MRTTFRVWMRSIANSLGLCAVWMLVSGCASTREVAPDRLRARIAGMPDAYAQSFDGDSFEGWVADKEESWQWGGGHCQVTTKGDDATVSLYLGAAWTGLLAEVDYSLATPVAAAGGLVVRATPDFEGWAKGSGYMFSLGSDGVRYQFAVYRQVNGAMSYLVEWTTNAALAAVSNKLGALVVGDMLQCYVNGKLVWEGRDGAIADGFVGLAASTAPGADAVHVFDNLSIKASPGTLSVAKPRAKGDKHEQERSGRSRDDKSPMLRPGLLIRVTVLVSGKPGVDAEVRRVTDNNQIDLPLIGPVSVKGMTLFELNDALQVWYKDYFIDPQALAEFVVDDRPDAASPWGSVVVLGRVRTPGRVNIPATQDLTVSGAIQQAGGLDTSARASAIRLTRRLPDGKTERIAIDLSAVGKRGDVDKDLILKPGDVIFVPEGFF